MKRLPVPGRLVLAALCALGLVLIILIWLRANPATERGRMERAEAEIQNARVAVNKMLADSDAMMFFGLFNNIQEIARLYGGYDKAWNVAIPELLRKGGKAKLDLDPEVRKKLASGYMNIDEDPWGNPYQFFAGPATLDVYGSADVMYYFRSYRRPDRESYTDGTGAKHDDYYYDSEAAKEEKAPNPRAADGLPGYPAPTDLTVYIWSMGKDGKSCQRVGKDLSPGNIIVGPNRTTGDDINNWDTQSGWREFYTKK